MSLCSEPPEDLRLRELLAALVGVHESSHAARRVARAVKLFAPAVLQVPAHCHGRLELTLVDGAPDGPAVLVARVDGGKRMPAV